MFRKFEGGELERFSHLFPGAVPNPHDQLGGSMYGIYLYIEPVEPPLASWGGVRFLAWGVRCMVYGVCMLYRIWCIEPVEPPWLARGGFDRTSRTPPGYGHGAIFSIEPYSPLSHILH